MTLPLSPQVRKDFITVTILAVLLVATYTVYQPGIPGTYLLDDLQITELKLDSLDLEQLARRVQDSNRFGGLSRSLTKATFAITGYLQGFKDPGVFKQQNLLLHLANGLLAFWFCFLIFNNVKQTNAHARGLALAVAAIWLLHPLQLSTVLYVVQRLVLLSAFFTLLALVLYLKGRLLLENQPRLAFTLIGIAFLALWPLALLSKENAAILPLYILLIELFVFRFNTGPGIQHTTIKALWFVFLALPILAGIAYVAAHPDAVFSGYAGRNFTLPERVMTEAHVLWLYLQLYYIPLPANMSLYHDAFPVSRTLDASTVLAFSGLIALMGLAILLRRRATVFGFGVLWFFASHSLESTIIPLELVFEHRNYMALVGLTIASVAIVSALTQSSSAQNIAVSALVALVLLLGLNTAARAYAWSSNTLLFVTQFEKRPDSPRLLEAMFYVDLGLGRVDDAREHLHRLREVDPESGAPAILEMRFYCTSNEMPQSLVDEAASGIRQGTLSAFEMNGLLKLANRTMGGKCPSLSREQLFLLTEAAAANPRVHVIGIRLLAVTTAALGAAGFDKWALAEAYARDALNEARSVTPQVFSEYLEQLTFIFLQLGGQARLQDLLDFVAAEHGEYIGRNKMSIELPVAVKPSLISP